MRGEQTEGEQLYYRGRRKEKADKRDMDASRCQWRIRPMSRKLATIHSLCFSNDEDEDDDDKKNNERQCTLIMIKSRAV